MLVVGEPNKKIVQGNQWIKHKNDAIVILFINKKKVSEVYIGNGFLKIKMRKRQIYCCCLFPNISFEECRGRVDTMMADIGVISEDKVIMGDINARSPLCGSPGQDKRGEYWSEWLAMFNLVVLNDGRKPTFFRRNTESHIDIICSTKGLHKEISNWEVLDDKTATQH